MQQIVQKITQHLIDLLPETEQYYRLRELHEWGFPPYIVQRIKIELERNLAESMSIPKTDWANTQSDAVLDAWQQFVDAIRADARLPASYGKTVIETAVADILEMLVQPRQNIPNVIFGNDQQLNYDQLCERIEAVVVYSHFATLIPRYMQKKELEELSKKRCTSIIVNADKKLTAKYSPLNWAQMLEPLFELVDNKVDTNLLRLFFEDKKMPRIARQFDLMNDTLNRAELIEVLSSPDLLNVEGDEEQSNLFDDKPAELNAEEQTLKDSFVEEEEAVDKNESIEPEEPTSQSAEKEVDKEDRKKDSPEVDSSVGERQNSDFDLENDYEKERDEEEDENSLNAAFKEQDSDEQDSTSGHERNGSTAGNEPSTAIGNNTNGEDHPEITPAEEKPDEVGNNDSEEELPEIENQEDTESNGHANGYHITNDEDEEEKPMWMRYMSEEEIAEYEKEQQEELTDSDADEQDEVDEEPIVDLTEKEPSQKEIEELRKMLSNDRELFVAEIFGGSDRAYEEAVKEIATYDNWKKASKYIENDIFKRNMVDMYSEAAVDFTDWLQTYFWEKENQ